MSEGTTSAAGKRVLVFHDSREFGGHEIAFLQNLSVFIDYFDAVRIVFCNGNSRFRRELERIHKSNLELSPAAFSKIRGEPYFAPFRFRYARMVRSAVADFRPSVILVVQGRIENACVPVVVLGSKFSVVSYLPMAHSMAVVRSPGLASKIGDAVRAVYYRRISRFIVPSVSVGMQVQEKNPAASVCIQPNTVGPIKIGQQSPSCDRFASTSRAAGGRYRALYIGRFEKHQKGLDHLVGRLQNIVAAGEWDFKFVGSGPDEGWLRRRLSLLHQVNIKIEGWTEDPRAEIAAADLILLPSRYEGVPLVMLEAIALGKAILASDIDVFREFLPPQSLVDFESCDIIEECRREIELPSRRKWACLDPLAESGTSLGACFARQLMEPD